MTESIKVDYKKFKSLSEFKKLIKVGAKIHTTMWCFYDIHLKKRCVKILANREIAIVQSNAFAAKTLKTDGTFVDSWLHWPKASEVKIVDDQVLEVYEKDRDGNEVKILSYCILND